MATIQASESVKTRIGAVAVDEGIRHGRLTIYPVRERVASGEQRLSYATLEDALRDGQVEVLELPGASVPGLRLRSVSAAPVLVLDGEEVIGGLQNRIANASYLVGQGEVTLPVSCVEQGRWSYQHEFRSGEAMMARMRYAKHFSVTDNLRARGRHTSDQGVVWDMVQEKLASEGVSSPTSSLHDVYAAKAAAVHDYTESLTYPEGAVGFVAAIGDTIVGAEIFDQAGTARALWPRLMRSFAADALDPRERDATQAPARDKAQGLLDEAAHAGKVEVFASAAMGEDVRLEDDSLHGNALVYEGTPVHISVFRMELPTSGSTWHARRARQWAEPHELNVEAEDELDSADA